MPASGAAFSKCCCRACCSAAGAAESLACGKTVGASSLAGNAAGLGTCTWATEAATWGASACRSAAVAHDEAGAA